MSHADAQEVRDFLLQSNEQYRQLAERHHELDHRLHELSDKQYLSAAERIEAINLKKRKLALKDQMELIAREYARQHSQAS
ncbi:MAG TPA: YdcH family protein [Vicinamibacterales bacterium]|nr:YdcH family protein [Vicinamibacterales bacterium]